MMFLFSYNIFHVNGFFVYLLLLLTKNISSFLVASYAKATRFLFKYFFSSYLKERFFVHMYRFSSVSGFYNSLIYPNFCKFPEHSSKKKICVNSAVILFRCFYFTCLKNFTVAPLSDMRP